MNKDCKNVIDLVHLCVNIAYSVTSNLGRRGHTLQDKHIQVPEIKLAGTPCEGLTPDGLTVVI